jgi:hypothetical protein
MAERSNCKSVIDLAPYASAVGDLPSKASTPSSLVPAVPSSSSTPTSASVKTSKKRHALVKGGTPAKQSAKGSRLDKQRQGLESSLRERVAVQARLEAREAVTTKKESPWNSFRKVYELKMDCFITVATSKDHYGHLVSVKAFPEQEAAGKVAMLQRIRHDKFLGMLECFSFENCLHVIFEHVPITLAQVVLSPPYLTELELAAILGQVNLRGLCIKRSADGCR